MPSTHTSRKSPERAAFEHYLRCGEALSPAEWLERSERKFNPYHDELGRFTFATGAAAPARMTDPPAKSPVPGRVAHRPAPPPATRPRRIAAITGYPETGKTSWRSSNDAAFAAAADYYNQKYGLRPGQKGNRTPEFLKAWAMRETGGEGDERHFRTDPFRVNVDLDWDDEKTPIAGLRKGQKMTPAASAYSALEWLRYKARIRDGAERIIGYRDDQQALERYNGNRRKTRQSGARPHYVWYAETIMQMAGQTSKVKP